MTRKKRTRSGERNAGAFHTSPFAELKGVIRKSSPAPQKAAPASGSHEGPEDAEALFLRSVSGVKQLARDGSREPGQHPASADDVTRTRGGDLDRDVFLRALGALGTAGFRDRPREQEEEAPPRSLSSRLRRLKRGEIRIGAELDLHGFQKDEAIGRLASFIADAHARGLQAVLVITGKGTNSPEGPVLPGAVDAWLRQQGRSNVAEFHTAPRDKGGSGAMVVFLKKR